MSALTMRLMLAALFTPVLALVGALLAGLLMWRRRRRRPKASP